MIKKLIRLIPPHREYVEVFGGGASLLFAKEPAMVETYNDIDSGLVNFFRVLRNPELFNKFYHLVCLTPYSREEYYHCMDTWADQPDAVERAYRWFIVARMSFGGIFASSWGSVVSTSRRGMAETTSKWITCLKALPLIHERMMTVQIEHDDWRTILDRYNRVETFAYLDPPYVTNTRSNKKYKHELTDDCHAELVEKILVYPGMIMLSGYDSSVYSPLTDAGWDLIKVKTACYAAGRTRHTKIQGEGAALKKQPRTECVWRNPACMETIRKVNGGLF